MLEDVADPFTGEMLVTANEEIDEAVVERLDKAGIERIRIRSVLSCRSRVGICARCYGRDLAHGHLVNIGEAVGIIAAQSIGEPGTQLTMRTFHIGGTAKFEEHSTLESRHDGKIKFVNLNYVKGRDKDLVVMNRTGEIHVLDDEKRSRGKYPVPYGAHLKLGEGASVKKGDRIAEWDPFSIPILSEVDGIIKFGDVVEGRTMQEQVDEVTGLSRKVIVESTDADLRPRVSIKSKEGKTLRVPTTNAMARYLLSVGVNIVVSEGDEVCAGEIIAKIPRETTKTKDITGGLPGLPNSSRPENRKNLRLLLKLTVWLPMARMSKANAKLW